MADIVERLTTSVLDVEMAFSLLRKTERDRDTFIHARLIPTGNKFANT